MKEKENLFKSQWDESYSRLENYIFYPKEAVVKFINKYVRKRVSPNQFKSILQSNTDLNKALLWMNQAISLSGEKVPFWYYRLKSLIQFKSGDKKGAIETAKLSIKAATADGDMNYVKMNEASIELWSKNK